MNTREYYWLPLLSLVSFSICGCKTAFDPGESALPKQLNKSIATRFPGFHISPISSYQPEDLEEFKKNNNGNACPTVARADVDGDGSNDFAVLLNNKSGTTLLIAARCIQRDHWDIGRLGQWRETPGRAFVGVIPSGKYQDMYDSANAPSDYKQEPGRVRKFSASHPGFVSGTLESSAVAYFFDRKQWVHLWLSD